MGLRLLLLICSIYLSACTLSPHLKLDGGYLNQHLKKADYILVGERHTNKCDHIVEKLILQHLLKIGLKPTIGLEMIPEPYQKVLDKFYEQKIPLSKLEKELHWKKNWGYNFSYYLPIFKIAKKHRLPIIALNIPSPLVVKWSKGKSLSPQEQNYLPYRIISANKKQIVYLKKQLKQHLFFAPQIKLNSFLKGQALWESKMAERAFWAYKKFHNPVLIYIGSGHIKNQYGLIYRLKILHPTATIFSFLPRKQRQVTENIYIYKCPSTTKSYLGLKLTKNSSGLKVKQVLFNSKAYKAGFKKGDIILKINNIPVKNLLDAHKACMKSIANKSPVNFIIKRNNKIIILQLDL